MRRTYARQAAAAGIDFVVVIAAIGAIERWKHLTTPGEIAVHASKNIFATVTLLHGIAAVFLFWFVSTLAARMRQLEGGSGRLAAAVNGSGAIVAGVLAIGVGAMWASHQLQSPESAALATSLLDGPTLFFPIAVLIGASGVIGVRRNDLPSYSRIVAWLSLPLAVGFVAAAGLILFKDYAWINDTGNIAFGAWILALSIIGIVRWGDLDEAAIVVADVVPQTPSAADAVEPAAAEPAPPKATPRKPAPSKPAPSRPARKAKAAPAPKPQPVRRARRRPEPEPEPETDEQPEPQLEPEPEPTPRKRRAPRKFAPRNTDLAREYQQRLHEAEEEEGAPSDDDDVDIDDLLFEVTPDQPTPGAEDEAEDADEDEDEDEDEEPEIDEEPDPTFDLDTDDEEFGYGGPQRGKPPAKAKPARRRPARRERVKREPAAPAATTEAPTETATNAPARRKPLARKPVARKPAPRKPAPRKVAPRGRPGADRTEIIPEDER